MNYLQLNYKFKWQTFAKKITFTLLSLSAFSYEATAATLSLPTVIQAENYLVMKGIKTAPAEDSGGLYVGWMDTTDWLSYASLPIKVPTTGSYRITYRVSSLEGGGSFIIRESNNGTLYDKVAVPRTGGWQKWTNVSRVVTLSAGVHTFGIKVLTSGFNLNWFKIESMNSTSSSSRPATTPSKPVSSKPASSKPVSTATSSSASSRPTGSLSSLSKGFVQIEGPVGISWAAPRYREDGTILDITEVGGYKIRYKSSTATDFTYVAINDAWTNTYNFSWLDGTYTFQIAAYDKKGRYSAYVDILQR